MGLNKSQRKRRNYMISYCREDTSRSQRKAKETVTSGADGKRYANDTRHTDDIERLQD